MDYSRIAPMMSHLWAPMAAVSSAWEGKHNAQIAVAISAASIVLDKPRVAIKLQKRNLTHDLIFNSGAFALNFLRTDQVDLIPVLGLVSGREVEKLADVPYRLGPSGSPVFERCWGYLDCRVVNALDGLVHERPDRPASGIDQAHSEFKRLYTETGLTQFYYYRVFTFDREENNSGSNTVWGPKVFGP